MLPIVLCSNFSKLFFLFTRKMSNFTTTLYRFSYCFLLHLPYSASIFLVPLRSRIHWTHSCRRNHKRLVLQFPFCVCVCVLYVYTRRGSQFNVYTCIHTYTRGENSSGIWEKKERSILWSNGNWNENVKEAKSISGEHSK